jgi:hypothetical protein
MVRPGGYFQVLTSQVGPIFAQCPPDKGPSTQVTVNYFAPPNAATPLLQQEQIQRFEEWKAAREQAFQQQQIIQQQPDNQQRQLQQKAKDNLQLDLQQQNEKSEGGTKSKSESGINSKSKGGIKSENRPNHGGSSTTLLRFVQEELVSSPTQEVVNQGVQQRLNQTLANVAAGHFRVFGGLELFGSAVSLFNLPMQTNNSNGSVQTNNSNGGVQMDLDFSLKLREPIGEVQTALLMNTISTTLAQAGYIDCTAINGAKIPLVKCTDRRTGIHCDISVNNEIAVWNSRMLRVYAEVSPVARQLGLLVKYWAKRRAISCAFAGTLSSYAWCVLVVHFLQQDRLPAPTSVDKQSISSTGAPILPCLQSTELLAATDQRPSHATKAFGSAQQNGRREKKFDVSFCTDVGRARQAISHRRLTQDVYKRRVVSDCGGEGAGGGGGGCDGDGVGAGGGEGAGGEDADAKLELQFWAIVLGFFEYYAELFPQDRVVTIHERYEVFGAKTKQQVWKKHRVPVKTWRVSIQDPFEHGRDLGSVVKKPQQSVLVRELCRARDIVQRISHSALGVRDKRRTTFRAAPGVKWQQILDELLTQRSVAAPAAIPASCICPQCKFDSSTNGGQNSSGSPRNLVKYKTWREAQKTHESNGKKRNRWMTSLCKMCRSRV